MPDTSKSSPKPKRRTSACPPSPSSHSTSASHASSRSLTHALHNVRRLPRKASRLVCIADPSRRGGEANSPVSSCPTVKTDAGVNRNGDKEGAERAGLVQHSDSGSGTGSESGLGSGSGSGSTGYSASVISQTCSSSSSTGRPTNPAWTPGPILSPDELARALARHSLTSTSNASPLTPSSNAESQLKPDLSAKRRESELPERRTPALAHIIAISTSIEDNNPIPRPLSPPPDHFRRRVLSGSASSSPYTTPVHSPPTSPRRLPDQRPFYGEKENEGLGAGKEEGGGGQKGPRHEAHPIRLHDLLSSDSLVAPPLRLFNGADDLDSVSDSESRSQCDSVFDKNLRVPALPPSIHTRGRDGGRGSVFLQPRLRSSSRSQAQGDAHTLRRVFSR